MRMPSRAILAAIVTTVAISSTCEVLAQTPHQDAHSDGFFGKLVLVVVGFALTTVVGGLLGALLQHRFGRYKWDT